MVLITVVFVFVPGPLEDHPGVRNPFGLEGYPWLQIVAVFVVFLLPVCILASAASLVLRYRRSATGVPAGRYASRSGGSPSPPRSWERCTLVA
jgi:hypothetical protein